jgi:hypothetical protein
VVSFDPIAGHGVENTTAMDAVGVARLASEPSALAAILAELTEAGPARTAQVERAAAMFRSSPAEAVLEVAGRPVPQASMARRSLAVALRTGVAGVAVAGVGWTGLTTGVAMAAYAGAGVAHPARTPASVAYVGVRLNAAEAADPAVDAALRDMGVTAVVDMATVQQAPSAVRSLVAAGVSVDSGGLGRPVGSRRDADLPWDQAAGDARAGRAISRLIDAPVTQAVPGRRLTAWDLVDCRHAHTALVVPNHVLHVTPEGTPIHVSPRDIYVVDGLGATPSSLASYLGRLRSTLGAEELTAEPLATLA